MAELTELTELDKQVIGGKITREAYERFKKITGEFLRGHTQIYRQGNKDEE